MEKRKIQRTGGSSFSITLPKKWIELNKIKEQDAVVLSSLRGGTLVIHSLASLEKQMKRGLVITGLDEEGVKREIIALYILGTEEIEVSAKTITHKQREAIREAVRLLIGFEIIEESMNIIHIKNILSSQKLSFKQSMEKMFTMARSMFKDAAIAFPGDKNDLARDIIERDVEMDKLYFLVLRYNHSLLRGKISEEELNLTLEQSHYYENIATQLERVADHAVKIAHMAQASKISIKRSLERSFQDVISSLLQLLQDIDYLVSSDLQRVQIHKVMDRILKVEKNIELFRNEATKSHFSEVLIISDSIDRVRGYLLNIVEASMDQSLAEK